MQASEIDSGELKTALLEYFQAMSYKMESWARTNKQWTDQTGDAKRGLTGFSYENNETLSVGVGHTVEYGENLELKYDSKYGILEPMIEHFDEDVRSGVSSITKAFCVETFNDWELT